MKKQDKIIAIAGVVIIIFLSVVALVLLVKMSGASKQLTVVDTEAIALDINNAVEETAAGDYDSNSAGIANSEVSSQKMVDSKTTSSSKKKADAKEKYVKATLKAVRNNDSQMAELYHYWDEYMLEAVGDLIRLERIRAFTEELSGTNQYYYYGDVDPNSVPNGKGLAIYENDTYYFGSWSHGERSGDGTWLHIYINETGEEGDYTGVTEHQYSGEFKNDLPNGKGQEHYSYQFDKITYELTVANAIGEFKDGYYSGGMYLMTVDREGRIYNWDGKAKNGSFEYCEQNKVNTTGKKPVLIKGEDNNHETDESDNGYYWMLDADNTNWGVFGLKK